MPTVSVHVPGRDVSPSERGGSTGGLACQVLAVDPPRFLYLKGWGAFVLEPEAGGKSARFFIRGRNDLGLAARIAIKLFLEPIHFIMQRRMMLGIKEVAEAGPEKPAIPSTADYVWFLSLVAAGLLVLFMTVVGGSTMRKLAAAFVSTVLVILALFRLPPSPVFGVGALLVVLLAFIWLRRATAR